MKKALIIGGGFTGCTAAYELIKKGWEVTLVEKEGYLGGGCRTFFYGGHPHTKGPRPLIIWKHQERVFDYINNIIPLRKFKLYLKTYVEKDANFYTYPIHEDDFERMPEREQIIKELSNLPDASNARNFEEFWKASVGETLYGKFIDKYTRKMWKVESNTQLEEASWSVKGVPIKKGGKDAFPENIHAYPENYDGYNQYFDFCLKDARVLLNTDITKYDLENRTIYIGDEKIQGDILVSTISPDELMDKSYGELPYIGRDFLSLVLPVEKVFPDDCHFIHYAGDEPFTRVVEYKKLTMYNSPSTFLGIEIPSFNNKLYSSKLPKDIQKAEKYLSQLPSNIYSIGRLGSYKYMCIAECLEQVWKFIDSI